MNYKSHKLNILKSTSIGQLRQMKKKMIASGEIDIGEMIAPIEYTTVKVNKHGSLVSTFYNYQCTRNIPKYD